SIKNHWKFLLFFKFSRRFPPILRKNRSRGVPRPLPNEKLIQSAGRSDSATAAFRRPVLDVQLTATSDHAMKSIRFHRFGAPSEVLGLQEVAIPEPGPAQVHVRKL